MQRLVYYLVYPFIWLLSKAPFPVLYLLSDFLFLLVYYLIGYRKELVLSNIKRAFPEKTEKEIQKIRKKFYHHFIDILLEMLKTLTISDKEITKRYHIINVELLEEINKKGKSIIIVGNHYANWEWMVSLSLHTEIESYGTYTKIRNKVLEKKFKKVRSRFGGHLILQEHTIKTMIKNYLEKKAVLYGLLSDQSPVLQRNPYWSDFLGVRVPIYTGAEKLAKRYDCAYVYMQVKKIKRGYYTVEFETITENPRKTHENQLTDIFIKKTEKQIREKPEYYLWSHNRFKHEGKEK